MSRRDEEVMDEGKAGGKGGLTDPSASNNRHQIEHKRLELHVERQFGIR